jgi:hypothetical protein
MAFLKAHPEELELVKETADRIAHRTHSKFVMKQERLEIVEPDESERGSRSSQAALKFE